MWSRMLLAVVSLTVMGAVVPAAAQARTATAHPVYGLAVPGAPWDLTALDAASSAVGVAPGQVTFYQAWSGGGDFPAAAVSAIARRGATPEMVWEPWDPALGLDQPAYALSRIAAGAYDAYLTRWAQEIRSYGGPLVIRFAHEMNGTWYPWAEGVNGNGPGSYVAAWRHVTGVFAAARVKNVQWSWSPAVPQEGATPLSELYPGNTAVQRVALDGYNWGTSQSWSTWQSFGDIFGPGVAQLATLSSKPIFIAETASTELGGDKVAWIAEMWTWLGQHPAVRGLTWFDFDKETDWRVDSSATSLQAFRAGVGAFVSG